MDPEQPELLAARPLPPALWEEEFFLLRRLFHATLVALLAPALAGALFFGKQMRLVRDELSEYRLVIRRLTAEYRQKEPRMRGFVAALQAYAVTHPDFQPVVQRYRAVLPEYFVTPISLNSSPVRFMPTNAPGMAAPPRK